MARKPKTSKKAKGTKARGRGAAAPRRQIRTVTPYLAIRGASDAIEWYKKAFGAKEITKVPVPGGMLMHAAIRIGDSEIYMSDIFPGAESKDPLKLGDSPVTLHLELKDVDAMWNRAVAAGARVEMPLDDQFWGDRYGQLADPFGHHWSLSSKSKAPKAVLERKREEAMKLFEKGQHP